MSTSSLNVPIASAEQDQEEDRPRSPWTPSYSVTNQGSAENDGVEPAQDLPASFVQEPAVGTTSEDTAPAETAPLTVDEDLAEPDAEPVQAEHLEEPSQPAITGPQIVLGDGEEAPVCDLLFYFENSD
jgi:hypothetical protein